MIEHAVINGLIGMAAMAVYLFGKYQGIKIGRDQMTTLHARLNPGQAERWTINIDAQVSEECKARCAQMIAQAHAAADWRLPK